MTEAEQERRCRAPARRLRDLRDADLRNGCVSDDIQGEIGARPHRDHRYLEISLRGSPAAKQQEQTPNLNVPSAATR